MKNKPLEAYEKIDNTLCLNCQSIKFNIDKEENDDCKDVYEMVKCLEIIKRELKTNEILKSHIVEIDNNQDNGDDYYFIVFEKTKEVRELLEKLKEVLEK